jgi:signal transduction histidine kinase
MLAHGRVDEARRQLGELAEAARSVYVDVREAILSLSTPVPPGRGVVAALEEYAAAYAESSKLAVHFNASPESSRASLTAAAQAEVFSIVREALTNVRKHARAQRVRVEVAVEEAELVVRVADDGVGFDADVMSVGPERWPHFGLAGMRERSESIGGRIAWHSRLGEGAVVELHVPTGGASWGLPQGVAAPSGETDGGRAPHQAVRTPTGAAGEAD